MTSLSFLDLIQRPEVDWFAQALLHFVWQGGLIAGLVFVANGLLSRAASQLRYALAFAGLLSMLAAVPATLVWLESNPWRLAAAPADVFWLTEPAAMEASLVAESVPLEPTLNAPLADSPWTSRWAAVAVTIYGAGVGLMILRLMHSYLGVMRLRASCRPVEDSAIHQRIDSGIAKHDVLLSYDNVRLSAANFVDIVGERLGKTCRLEFMRAGKRSWTAVKPRPYIVRRADPAKLTLGKRVYASHCAHCHGETGNGDGKTAQFLTPSPRDFHSSQFRRQLASGQAGRHLDTVIKDGIAGTAMPSFSMLPAKERSALVEYVEYLSTSDSIQGGRNPRLRFPIEVERGMLHERERVR